MQRRPRPLVAGRGPARPRDEMTDVFAALADPTRRTVMERLAREPATATQIASELPVTRQAVAKHLGVLADAGLVRAERAGRERRYSPTPAPLGDAISWMAAVGGEWDDRLAALQRYVRRAP